MSGNGLLSRVRVAGLGLGGVTEPPQPRVVLLPRPSVVRHLLFSHCFLVLRAPGQPGGVRVVGILILNYPSPSFLFLVLVLNASVVTVWQGLRHSLCLSKLTAVVYSLALSRFRNHAAS